MSEEQKAIQEAKKFLDSLIEKAKKKVRQKDFEIKVEVVKTVRDLTGRRVTITSFLRQASVVFLDFWPPETIKSNWDDLIKWVMNRP